MKTYHVTHRTQNQEYRVKKTSELRNKLHDILGRRCVRCGYHKDIRALQFDHINGDGHKEKLLLKGHDQKLQFYCLNPELAKQRLQVLCANCNYLKRFEDKELLYTVFD